MADSIFQLDNERKSMFINTEKKERGQYSASLKKDIIYAQKGIFFSFLREQNVKLLACLVSQQEHTIPFFVEVEGS